jgi:transcriptional regulator with XRE-family HTH domain
VLKKAREAKGISVSELATKVCFSVKQIEQLENGEKSHFYSLAIKANAAKRVADELGLAHEEVFDFGPDLVQETKVSESRSMENTSDDEIKNSAREPSIGLKSQPQPEQLERFHDTTKPIVKKNSSLYVLGGAAVVAAIGIVIFNVNQSQPIKPPELAKLPSESIGNAGDLKKEELPPLSQSTPTAAAPTTSAVAGVPFQAVDGCPAEEANSLSYRSPVATKAGNMVFVQSRITQTVCMKDASGKLEKKSLEAGGSHTFYGKSPFVVLTSGLGQTDLFFQGYKVKIDNPNAKSITLEEVAF